MIEPGGSRRPPWPPEPRRPSGLDQAAGPAGPLRGRGPEVEILGEALDRVAAGRPALVLIEGEAGIGKTRLLDGALEDALAAAGAPALQVAEHLARAAAPGDTDAIRWLTRAAREAVATSPDAAASLLTRATGLMDPADPGRDALLAEQAGSLLRAGRLAETEATCRALLGRDHDPSVTAGVRIRLGRTLMAGGRSGEALLELERAAASAAPASAELATARAYESFSRLSLGDLDGASAAAAEAQSAGSPAGGHQNTSVAMTSLALAAQLRGELSAALQITDDAASGAAGRAPPPGPRVVTVELRQHRKRVVDRAGACPACR